MDRVKKILNVSYAYQRGYFGEGVGVAILDTGIYLHPDLCNQISGFRDYIGKKTNAYDDNGHGTHVAGIIGGNGAMSGGIYSGIAPASRLFSCKVLDQKGNGNTRAVVEAIQWLVAHQKEYQIRIINISVGMLQSARNQEQNQLLKTVEYAWDSGMIVVAAAGNNGPKDGSVTIPGISRKIITVGCFDDENPDGKVRGLKADYSGRGPTENCIMKPELVACGTNIVSCGEDKSGYTRKSGTSMAAPVVSGVIALLLSKYPWFTPKDVKLRLYERAVDLGLPTKKQGWGTVDMSRLL